MVKTITSGRSSSNGLWWIGSLLLIAKLAALAGWCQNRQEIS